MRKYCLKIPGWQSRTPRPVYPTRSSGRRHRVEVITSFRSRGRCAGVKIEVNRKTKANLYTLCRFFTNLSSSSFHFLSLHLSTATNGAA